MMRVLVLAAASTLLLSTLLLSTASLASPRSTDARSSTIVPSSADAVKLAKAPRGKKKGGDKAVEKAAPEGARTDPRAAASAAEAAPAADPGARRGMGRIEFDDRLIQGQTNKANAIYLFERRESALRSLLKKRTDFHEEIDETLE